MRKEPLPSSMSHWSKLPRHNGPLAGGPLRLVICSQIYPDNGHVEWTNILCLWKFEFVFLVHLSFGHKVVILVLCRPSCFFIIRSISIWRRLLPELTRARWLWRHKDQNSERQRFETTNSVLTSCPIVTALGWFGKSSCILVDPETRNIQDPWLFFNFVFFQLLIEWIVSGWNVRGNQ